MKARPILFSGPMVRALLDGTKTQTRRIIKPQPIPRDGLIIYKGMPRRLEQFAAENCPYGTPGDLLWVRETFVKGNWYEGDEPMLDENEELMPETWYRATDPDLVWQPGEKNPPWKPSIHMPRADSRLTLLIESIRAERLHDISGDDAQAEGIEKTGPHTFRSYLSAGDIIAPSPSGAAIASYSTLWSSINGPESWAANPWVWVVTFSVIKKNVDTVIAERQAA